MARLDLPENQKFKRLALALNGMASGMGAQLARGLLETLWSAAYERADDFLGDAFDVALAADWKGDPEAFVRLLSASPPGKAAGFIEMDEARGGYVIHDFEQHAPQWVKVKMAKKAEREAAGKTLSDIRRDAALKSKTARAMQKTDALAASGEQTHNRLPSKNDNGTGRDGTGVFPPKPPQGGSAGEGPLALSPPAAVKPTRRRSAAAVDVKSSALAVLDEFNAARQRLGLGGPLRPTDSNLEQITGRLREGATAQECIQVLAVVESEVAEGGDARWFNPVTPFRKSNFPLKLAAYRPPPPELVCPVDPPGPPRGVMAIVDKHLTELGLLPGDKGAA